MRFDVVFFTFDAPPNIVATETHIVCARVTRNHSTDFRTYFSFQLHLVPSLCYLVYEEKKNSSDSDNHHKNIHIFVFGHRKLLKSHKN